VKTYLRHRICNVIDVKELIVLEFLDFEGKYRNYVESHDFWELCWVQEGNISVFVDDTKRELSKNQLILLPPNKKHSYYSECGNNSKVFVICFDSFSQSLSAIESREFLADESLQRCMDIILQEWKDTFSNNDTGILQVLPQPLFGGQQVILLQLEYLLISLVRKMSVDENSGIVFFSDENFYADLVNVILRFLRENVSKKLSLNDICSKFSYSRSFLCKTFKEQTGETLIACFNRLKIEEAKRLLVEGTQSVTGIAGTLGFREVKYFDAIFKKQTGMTPVAYRDKYTKLRQENGL